MNVVKYIPTYLVTLYIEDSTLFGLFFCFVEKTKKNDFEENKFNEKFFLHQIFPKTMFIQTTIFIWHDRVIFISQSC